MRLLLLAGAALIATPALAQTVTSPDGHNAIVFALSAQGEPTWSARRDGVEVVPPSPIGFELADGTKLASDLALIDSQASEGVERYALVAGKSANVADAWHGLVVHLARAGSANPALTLELRAFNSGVAFRSIIAPATPGTRVVLAGEATQFRLPAATACHGFNVGHFGSSHEGEYDAFSADSVRPHALFDLPVSCMVGGKALALTEAGLENYAGLYLTGHGEGGPGFSARLSPSLADPRWAVGGHIGQPLVTPWRIAMLGDRLGDFIPSTLVTSLAAPSRLPDTSWIKPGLAAWDWWNGPVVDGVDKPGTNTATARAFIDFAAAHHLPYSLIDEGWYEGTGNGIYRPGTDVLHWSPEIDLPGLVAYGRDKGVRLWLWFHWKALDAQMDEALAQYAAMGIAGIKVDFMDRDDQDMVAWYHRLLAAAARHHLMVDLHGAFVPRGLARTWPNFLTQEGVMGAEYNKWSRRVTPAHNVALAYTRGLLGPMDYTPGGFGNVTAQEFTAQNTLPLVQTTRAQGLAMYVVYESPFATLADSPRRYAADPAGLEFIEQVPTTWDETRFLGGDIDSYVAVARRSGQRWFVGVMNTDKARRIDVPLELLGKGLSGTLWRDGDGPTRLIKQGAKGRLTLTLAPGGGAVAILAPSMP